MQVIYLAVKKMSVVGYRKIVCFVIYCGSQSGFGNGKSPVCVTMLDGGEDVLLVFSQFFGDSFI